MRTPSNTPQTLIRSPASLQERLYKAVKAYSEMEDDQLREAARHGADAGWPGFIYNDEAAEFFDRHADLIWEALCDLADSLGEPSPIALIAGFNRIDMTHSHQGFKVLLAWFALEEAGRYLEQ